MVGRFLHKVGHIVLVKYPMMHIRRRGFTLVEILTTLLLLGIVMGVTVGYSQSATHKAAARSGAESLAQVFRSARSKAMASGVPVTVAFPSANGATPLSQGCYLLEGEVRPRQIGRFDLARESKSLVFCGLLDSGTPPQTQPTQLGLPSDGLSIPAMQLPHPKDYAFVYTPSGVLKSNGLPLVNGSYAVLVCRSARSHAASLPSPPDASVVLDFYQLDSAAQAYTVNLGPLGEVNVSNGVASAQSTPEEVSQPTLVGALPSVPASSGQLPVVTEIKLLPSPEKLQLPSGVDTLVPKESLLTLEVSAQSPSGLPLYCQWKDITSERPPGVTSTAVPQRMNWDAQREIWVARGHWKAPGEATDGLQYTILCEVKDIHGNLAPATTQSMLDLEVRARKKRLLISFMGPHPLTSVDEDGEDVKYVTSQPLVPPEPGQAAPNLNYVDSCTSWSPDGTRLLVYRQGSMHGLFTMAADGSGERRLLPEGMGGMGASWSPSGEALAFVGDQGGQLNIYKANADGSSLQALTNFSAGTSIISGIGDPMRARPLSWRESYGSEPESVFCYLGNDDGSASLQQIFMDSSPSSPHLREIARGYQMDGIAPGISPDGQWCVYTRSGAADGSEPAQLRVFHFSSGSETQISNTAAQGSWMSTPIVSASGDILVNGPDGKVYKFNATTPNQAGQVFWGGCPPHTFVQMMDANHLTYAEMTGTPRVVQVDLNQPTLLKTLYSVPMGAMPILGGWSR